mmetsp:Transcript_8431/g.28294  ORF Transcript_8431/g.28294 Transcript_8431/m.28294 type:complete len:286 (-) Transcript_8431:373-1230(-)
MLAAGWQVAGRGVKQQQVPHLPLLHVRHNVHGRLWRHRVTEYLWDHDLHSQHDDGNDAVCDLHRQHHGADDEPRPPLQELPQEDGQHGALHALREPAAAPPQQGQVLLRARVQPRSGPALLHRRAAGEPQDFSCAAPLQRRRPFRSLLRSGEQAVHHDDHPQTEVQGTRPARRRLPCRRPWRHHVLPQRRGSVHHARPAAGHLCDHVRGRLLRGGVRDRAERRAGGVGLRALLVQSPFSLLPGPRAVHRRRARVARALQEPCHLLQPPALHRADPRSDPWEGGRD